MENKTPDVDRRDFIKTGAATAGALVAGAAMSLPAASYQRVNGANGRIGVAFLGVGGRCQQHVDAILAMQRREANSVRPVAVCDVWDGDPQLGRGLGRGWRRCVHQHRIERVGTSMVQHGGHMVAEGIIVGLARLRSRVADVHPPGAAGAHSVRISRASGPVG